jgi:xanthine dehydrogenase large subunit
VAHALNIPLSQVRVVCRRMGGGFGGKETQAGHLAVWAALAAQKFGRPVKMRLDRGDDILITGKRHPFSHDWQVGFDAQGRVLGLESVQLVHCGQVLQALASSAGAEAPRRLSVYVCRVVHFRVESLHIRI